MGLPRLNEGPKAAPQRVSDKVTDDRMKPDRFVCGQPDAGRS